MTTEEKAKAYDMALEAARKELAIEPIGNTKEVLAEIFPELRESEDERIRKEIRNFLIDMECKKEWIAYMEKQKEPVVDKEGMYYYFGGELIYCGYPETTEIPYDFAINQQEKEQRPEGIYVDCTEHPEWYGMPAKEQKPAEWSEEDEKTISDSCCWLAEYAGYLMDKNYGKASMLMGLTEKLKSLRPQPHWKPSEEQMEALESAMKLYKDTHFEIHHKKIVSLYEQLKKLI